MKMKTFLLIICVSLLTQAWSQNEKTCIIKGKLMNLPNSTELQLINSFLDPSDQSLVHIPIKDETFYYKFHFKDVEAYTMMINDGLLNDLGYSITFFPADGTISMDLYPEKEYNKDIISGGKENSFFVAYQKRKIEEMMKLTQPFRDSMNVLKANGNYDNQEMKDMTAKLKSTKNKVERYNLELEELNLSRSGEGLSVAASKLQTQIDSIYKQIQERELTYISNNMTIPSYYLLIRGILQSKFQPRVYELEPLIKLQKVFASKFKNHPYTKYSNEIVSRLTNLKPGADYFDFALPDTIGTKHTLSKEIKGKYAVIDIWAPWCGSCLLNSSRLKSIYDTYKDKGFTVVGVASKYENIDNVFHQLRKNRFPWVTLIDEPKLDSQINQHYGTETAGGTLVLIDNTGKIMLVSPTIEEIQKVLKTKLTDKIKK